MAFEKTGRGFRVRGEMLQWLVFFFFLSSVPSLCVARGPQPARSGFKFLMSCEGRRGGGGGGNGEKCKAVVVGLTRSRVSWVLSEYF